MEKLKSTKNQNQHIAGIVESGFGKHETTTTTTGRKSSSKVNKNNNNNNNSASENRRNNSSNSYSNHNISVSAITTRSSSFRSSTIAKRAKTEISTSTNNNSNVNSFMKSDKCSKYGGGSSSDVKPKTSNRRKQKGTTAHKKSDDDDERIAESSETIITVGKLDPETETHEDKCEESSVGKVDEFDGDPDVSSDTEDNDNNKDDKKKDWGNEKESMVNPTSLISVNSNNNNNLKLAEPPQPSSICPTTTTSSSSGGSNSVLTTSLRSKSNLNSNWNFRPTTVSASTISESQHQQQHQAHQSGGVVGEGSDCDMTTTTTTTSMGVELKSQVIPQSVVHMIKNERTSPSPSSSSGSSSPVPSLSAYPLITSAALAFVESQQILLPNLHSKPSGNSSHQSHFASNNNESHKNSHGLRHSNNNNNNSNLNVKTSSMAASVSTNANGPTTTPSSANKNKHGSSSSNNNNNNAEPSKIAPQNLMNNLPYMGELTFDTRPRRGRKPKKADICHLISKNYGIHFPNSYVNIPSSFPTPRVPVPNPVSTGPSARDSTSRGVNSGSRGAKNKSSSRSASARQQQNPNNNPSHHAINNKNISSTQQSQFTFSSVDPSSLLQTNLSSSSSSNHERHRRHNNNSTSNNRRSHNPPNPNPKEGSSLNDDMANDEDDGNGIINTHLLPNWTHHVPPDLLPLASLNPEALFQHHQLHQQQQQQINSKNPPGPGSGPGQGVGKKKTLARSQQQSFPRDTVRSQNQDEPLNLCVRDKESSHLNHLNLLSATASINNMYSSTSSSPHPHPACGNVGKPSANNLFNNFNLRLNAASKNLFSTSPQQLGHHGGHHGKSLNPKSQQVHSTVNKRGSSSSSSSATYQFESSNNTNTDHSNIVSDDPNLVNLNLQLNLCASKLTNSANNNNNNNSNSNRPMHSASSTVGNNIDSSMRANNNNHINNSNNHNNRALTAPLPLGGNNNNGTTGKNPKGRRKRGSNFLANNSVSSSAAASSGNVHPSYSHNSNSLYNLNCTPSTIMSHQQQSSSHFNPNHHSMQSDNTNNNPVEINISPFASSPSNPAEVSICKFKFTGGAKPSLQEKKMLSVDSGGNFRFYSDKACSSSAQSKNSSNNHHSNHMYHHQGSFKDDQNSSGELISNSHGLPKSAKSMSMCMPVPIPSMSTCSVISEIQQSPSLPSMASPGELDCSSSSDGGTSSSLLPSPTGMISSAGQYDPCGSGTGSSSNNKIKMNKRKRRTRKSLMREKLEKTFKEKGFLIQTQQLESAEGATYCKFRQLRKFTRYLFRSWKDYLPDNLKGINPAVAGQAHMEANALGLQGMSSDNLSEGGMDHGSMELEQDGDDSDCGSDYPDNLTLSPAETHGDQDNDQQDPDDDDDEMVDDT